MPIFILRKIISILLWPIMPKKMEQLLASLGEQLILDDDIYTRFKKDNWTTAFTIKKVPPLFEKVEGRMKELEQKAEQHE